MLDLIIIGGSAAGCGAAIYAARRKLNFKIISKDIGGEVALSGETNNWPGVISIEGFDLAQKFAEHVKFYGVDIEQGWSVENIAPRKNYHIVEAKDPNGNLTKIETKTVIIATGIHPRRLGVPGEDRLDRKGVTFCTVCDGPLFKGKDTLTVGSGNAALESALMMAGIASNVYVFSKYANTAETQFGFPKGDKILIDKLTEYKNINVIYQAQTLEILGEKKVEGVKYSLNGKPEILNVQGVMVHIGMVPNSQIINTVEKNKLGEIIVNTKCHTNVPGIYAAGDVTNIPHKQIVIAAGQGVMAALEAIRYINLWK